MKEILSSSTSGAPQQIFAQALVGSQRTTAALSALNEAKSRQTELLQIEQSLVELSQLIQQVAELVAEQDPQVVKIEENAEAVHGDIENGLKGIQKAKLSAQAARHKRKICAAIGLVMLVIIVVVIVVQFKGSGGSRGNTSAPKEGEKEAEKTPLEFAAAGLTDQLLRLV